MYFKNRDDTCIDDEFNDYNILSRILNFIFKYKIFVVIFLVLLFIILLMLVINNNNNNNNNNNDESGVLDVNYLVLNGDKVITIYRGSDYIEPGYNAYNSKNENLNKDVKVSTNININVVGEYEIKYILGDIIEYRKIIVIEKPKTYVLISLNKVDNNVDIFLKVGDKYVEPGYQVFSSTGKDLNDKVKITGNVDTSKKGKYELKYSLVDEDGATITVSRFVTVIDTEISLSLDSSEYTNKDVGIKVLVNDDFFDYIILPDGKKISQNNYVYKVFSNGKYTFKTYNTKGMVKEQSINVSNINKTLPTGSCSGVFENGVSLINVNANDDIGIKKYEIDGYSYVYNQITINKELSSVTVKIYDRANNVKIVSCNLKDNNKSILFGKNIKLSYKFYNDNNYMKYVLYSPNIDNKNKKIPLIIWLHGSGEVGTSENMFVGSGFLKVLNEWKLEGFNAYVLCPLLSSGSWNTKTSENKLFSLIDKIVTDKNIDKSKIIISGHSLGGIGVQYMAFQRQNYFSAMVVLSGYDPGVDLNKIKNIPARAYAEVSDSSYNYTMGKFASVFGKDKVTVLNTWHGNVPNMAFNEDKNGDGRSDLIEWMLTQ